MGTWSEEIFGSDAACDVRDEYRERVTAGVDAKRAVAHIKKEFSEQLRDSDEKWIVWIALAAAELEAGSVLDEVREKALKGIAWYQKSEDRLDSCPFGASALAAFSEQLGGPTPKPAKKPKPPALPGNKGDVLAIKLPNSPGEGVIIVGGPVGHDRGPGYGRVVLLQELTVEAVTRESVQTALVNWRPYLEKWTNSLGRSIGCYDAKGKLPVRKTRVLLSGVEFPPPFEQRMQGTGRVERSADMPWIVENDLNDWHRCEWVVDPEDSVNEA